MLISSGTGAALEAACHISGFLYHPLKTRPARLDYEPGLPAFRGA